jgi:hypothetical protein
VAIDQAPDLAQGTVPVVALELATVPAEEVQALPIDRAAVPVLLIALAEAQEPETVQAPVEREHVPVAVRLKTKSAIAAHPRGLRPLLAAEEDLAAAVEIMPEPAATEAAVAWAAAVTAVAVAPE